MRILLVDDHPLFREGLRLMLASLDAGAQILQAGSAEEALQMAPTTAPVDLILLDFKLPGMSGLEALDPIRTAYSDARLVILSGETAPAGVNASIEAGAMGYIPKTSSPEVLMSALRLVMSNGVYLPAEIMLAAQVSEQRDERQPRPSLTDRQHAVLKLLVEGAPNKRIAQLLNIGEATVKTHIAGVFRALGVRNRTEAVYASARLGLQFY